MYPPPDKLKAFPIAVVTTCRKLLIVGGGFEDDIRLRHACQFGWYSIKFLAPDITDELRAIAGDDPRVTFEPRLPTEQDIKDADVVFEDSGRRELAEQITAWCRANRVRINAMDKPELCDMFYMSMLRRGPLMIAIGSGGDSPAISSILRKWLEQKIGPGWETASRLMAELRASLPGGHERMDLLKKIARHEALLGLIEANDEAGMRALIDDALQRVRDRNR